MVKLFRVGFAFFVALVCVISPVSSSVVSPAWAVTEWTQVGSDIDGEAAGDFSGQSVSFSSDGSRVAIGANENGAVGTKAGQVRIYDLVGSTWVQVGSDIDGEATQDYSGERVSLSSDGSRVAIAAPNNDGGGPDSGHVRIYQLVSNAWVQVGADINGEQPSDTSGTSVSLNSDGSRVAIGAHANDGSGSNAGHVRVYEMSGAAWVKVGDDIDGEVAGDFSGASVSLSSDGSRVAIGSKTNSGGGTNAGQVRVYDLVGTSWVQVGSDIDGEAEWDNSGGSVSLSSNGSRVAIGAIGNDGGGALAGHVRVYQLDSNAWVKIGSDIDGEAAGDQSGGSVALSSDGSRVAIGARANDGGGDAAGQLRVYDLIGDAWVQVGSDIDGEAAGDESGGSVALSSDGSRATIGARLNGGSGISAGHVRVYGYPVPEDENETPSEELAETGGVDASGIAFGGAIALVVGVGGYLLRRRGARA